MKKLIAALVVLASCAVVLTVGVAPAISSGSLVCPAGTSGKIDRTRPLCMYPQVARYKGTGSSDEAANFSCVTEAPSTPVRKTTSSSGQR